MVSFEQKEITQYSAYLISISGFKICRLRESYIHWLREFSVTITQWDRHRVWGFHEADTYFLLYYLKVAHLQVPGRHVTNTLLHVILEEAAAKRRFLVSRAVIKSHRSVVSSLDCLVCRPALTLLPKRRRLRSEALRSPAHFSSFSFFTFCTVLYCYGLMFTSDVLSLSVFVGNGRHESCTSLQTVIFKACTTYSILFGLWESQKPLHHRFGGLRYRH